MTISTPVRRVQRVRHELLRRDVRVHRIDASSPGFLSITFAGESLRSFVSLSFDDHIKLIIRDRTGSTAMRDFTPLHFDTDRGELTLEFALHAHGPACDWAHQARVGDEAIIGGPKGSMIIPTDYDWHLLAGDASALPAIRRRLQELPEGSRALVLAQIPDASDRVLPTSRPSPHHADDMVNGCAPSPACSVRKANCPATWPGQALGTNTSTSVTCKAGR
jgi:NADPH-dependent ferric siderophore reductase